MSLDGNAGSRQLNNIENGNADDLVLQLERNGASYRRLCGRVIILSSFLIGLGLGIILMGLVMIVLCVGLLYY